MVSCLKPFSVVFISIPVTHTGDSGLPEGCWSEFSGRHPRRRRTRGRDAKRSGALGEVSGPVIAEPLAAGAVRRSGRGERYRRTASGGRCPQRGCNLTPTPLSSLLEDYYEKCEWAPDMVAEISEQQARRILADIGLPAADPAVYNERRICGGWSFGRRTDIGPPEIRCDWLGGGRQRQVWRPPSDDNGPRGCGSTNEVRRFVIR